VKRALAVLALVLALTSASSAAPLVDVPSRDARIELACESGLEDVAERLGNTARDSLDDIARDLAGMPQPHHVRIQLVRDATSLARYAPAGRGAPPWAIGVAYPDLGVVTIALRSGPTIPNPRSTLRHELAHLALHVALGERVPRWLHEGFANQHADELSFDRIETLAGMAWFGGIIDLDVLDASFPNEESPAQRAYAESYDFVGFLARRGLADDGSTEGDRAPFHDFLRAIGSGASVDAAARAAYRRPLRMLFEEWRNDLAKHYLFAPLGVLALGVWVLCAFLLVLAWRRRRRQNRARLAQWERDEADIVAPPYVPWPGEDPLAHDPDEHERDPHSIN
jgi:hypothetical protein